MVKIFIIILIIIIIFFIGIMIIDGNRFVIRQYSFHSPKLTQEYCFVLLADLHGKQYGRDNAKLIEAIERISPDSVMCGGDMITARAGKKTDTAVTFLSKLSEKYPVYYGIGNHEYRMKIYPQDYGNQYGTYMGELRKRGIKVLENTSVEVRGTPITVNGAMIARRFYHRFKTSHMEPEYLKQLLDKRQEERYTILLAHNPDYLKQYADWGADMVLSGHVHGGIMRLPLLGGVISPKCTFFPKYDGGVFREKSSTMVLSRGLGMHTIPIRIFNPGELVVVHLLPEK